MKIKYRVTDFRVSELLEDGYIRAEGPFSVYRVTKRKLSTPEAAHFLAERAGVDSALVAVAGLKDRQGVTVQHMSVPGHQRVRVEERELRIEHVGFAAHELSSQDSRGNAFHVVVRSVDARELAILRRNIPTVREHGVPNYFDDQRFGNLRHQQGWIARDLMQGNAELALQSLLAAPSPFDHDRLHAFKSALRKEWGDWRACRDVAGRFGSHHSIFEYLTAQPDDFAGAFYHVASRIRLIHLFAYQSHVWNRAVAELVRRNVPTESRVLVDSAEGGLVCFEGEAPAPLAGRSFRLPGPGLEDVRNAEDRAILTEVLASEGIAPEDFRIDGVSGFQLKGEDRELVVHPRHLRVRPATDDPDHRGTAAVVLRFELPRGAYATLVVKRLFTRSEEKRSEYHAERSRAYRKGEWVGHAGERRGREDDAPRLHERGPARNARDATERRSVPHHGSGKTQHGRAPSAGSTGRRGGGSREDRDRRGARSGSRRGDEGERRGRDEGRGTAWRNDAGRDADRRGAGGPGTGPGRRWNEGRTGGNRHHSGHAAGSQDQRESGNRDASGRWSPGRGSVSSDRGGDHRSQRPWGGQGGGEQRGRNASRGSFGRRGENSAPDRGGWRGGGDENRRGGDRGRSREGGGSQSGDRRGGERRGDTRGGERGRGTRVSPGRTGGRHGDERKDGGSSAHPAKERE